MALYLKEGSEESNIRGLVETCAHNDDITPLVKLVFEAQALADTPPSIAADGQTMVSIICGALTAVADDQAAAVEEVCHSNATAIAHTVAELEQMHRNVEDVKDMLLASNSSMQAAGQELVGNVQHENQLAEVQDNLQQAAAAVQAAQAVLEQCLTAGELIGQQQLYPALCMLDKIRRQHLASLLSMLSGARPAAGKGGSGGGSSTAAAAAAGSSSSRHMTGCDLEHLQQLHVFFNSLVDDMSANVQRLALRGFNSWLVCMRACAREVGLSAIQSAAVERGLEEQLAAERKALLAALHRHTGPKSIRELAAEFGQSGFRQELLKAAAEEAATQTAASKAATSGGGGRGGGGDGSSGSSAGGVGGSSGGDKHSVGGVGGAGGGSGGSFTAASQSLRDILKRPTGKDKAPRQLTTAAAAAAEAAAAAAAAQQQPGGGGAAGEVDLDELYPGETEVAVRDVITRRGRLIAERVQQEQQQQQQQVASGAVGGLQGLMKLDMSGLYTAVHVAKSLGQLDVFRQHYLDQRRLQISADLQPPSSFLQTYQAYLAQVTGFFVLESFVARVTEDLLGPQEAAQLWGVALRSLKGSLESAFETQLSTAPQMLMVKEFVVLMCVALERAGHQVVPVTEILQSTCGRYHDLLAATVQVQLSAVVDADVLGELEVRAADTHRHLVDDYNLPWQLEGAGAVSGRRVQLGPGGVPPLPYVCPFTACVPELLRLIRKFIMDSLAYLRDLYSPWELLPAVFHQRDRMMTRVLVEVLSFKARAVGAAELLRESMKCAANAWALTVALDGLDDWTLAQIRPDTTHPEIPQREASGGGAPIKGPAAAAAGAAAGGAPKSSRARNRKAVLASGALTNTVQTALKALQESSERDVLYGLTGRIEQVLESSRKADWTPSEPLPSAQSPWVNSLLSYLQEIYDTGIKLLPRSSIVNIMRMALRAIAAACMRTFQPDGVKAFNMYAIEKLAHNLLTVERFASRWGVATLDEQLAEPTQLCRLLLSGKVDEYVSSAEVRQQYPAVSPTVLLKALEKYKEVPGQAKKKPDWASKKAADAAVKQLKAQAAAAAAAVAAASSTVRLHDLGEMSPVKPALP